MVAPGQGYGRLRAAFTELLNDRWYALLVTTKYLGGAITSRDHLGDPNGRPPVTTVSAEQQRAALAFIAESGFGEQAYRFRPRSAHPAGSGSVDATGAARRRRPAGWISRCTTGR